MKSLNEILEAINKNVEEYETKDLGLTHDHSKILRDLSSNLYFLTEYRIKAHEEWLGVYFEISGSNAAKEKEADYKVPELYRIRHFMTSGFKVLESMRSTISANKSN
jgi:hypothetical protein